MRRVRIELSDYEACEYLGYGSNLNVEMQRSVVCCGFQRRGVREGTPRRAAVVGVTFRVLHLVRRLADNDDSSFGLPRNAIYVEMQRRVFVVAFRGEECEKGHHGGWRS